LSAGDTASVFTSPLPLVDRLAEELGQRWRAGERPSAEEYLALYPELAQQPEAAIELIYEELCLRQEYGQPVDRSEILRRFPQWAQRLRVIIECQQFLNMAMAPLAFPEAGDYFGDFQLLAELGRGGNGRVFLAKQPGLADRAVVLKLTPRSGQEHLALARLQNTHIVPLYWVHDEPRRGLRALCMPYFGGATLARILEILRPQPVESRSGQDLLSALRQAQAALPIPIGVQGTACRFLARASFVRAVSWMGACLADALQYTHEHGLVHLDLKPSNVLWAADGEPMLLDLHLARGPIPAQAAALEWVGGTVHYMAPEQRLAFEAVRRRRCAPLAVDGRADIYGLGMVLCEALGGALPPPGKTIVPWLKQRNSRVSMGLGDILSKCLSERADERYREAGELAADLRRHIADQPLVGVANRNIIERWQKWRRRKPYSLGLTALILSIVIGLGCAAGYIDRETRKARLALAQSRAHVERREYEAAAEVCQQGLTTVEHLPFQDRLVRELRTQLGLAEEAKQALSLHQLVERLRPWYGVEAQPSNWIRAVAAHASAIWQRRDEIVRGLSSSPEREQVRRDLLDLAILWADLRVSSASANEARRARAEAIDVLAQAEALFGQSCVLDMERQTHLAALGRSQQKLVPASSPRTSWEHYAVGRAYLRAGDLDAAAREFEQSLALEPQGLWPNYYQGASAYRRGKLQDAVLAFTACTVLAPDQAWCYYNRGLAHDRLGQSERALADYTRALELDGTLAQAALNRGMLQSRLHNYNEALQDLERALASGTNPIQVHCCRALVHWAQGDHRAAITSLSQALQPQPEYKPAAAHLP
jgi:serine/threonine protein kinase/Flp pilus assembly protein TadD